MALELVWTAGAEADLLNLHQQLFELLSGDEDAISKVLEAPLQSSLQLLRGHPELAPRVRGSSRVRRRLLGPGNRYGLFYTVEQRGLIIHALLDLRQHPQTILRRLGKI
jgi:plasmid stabilization system protein ParE